MKRSILCILAIICMVLCLAACGKENGIVTLDMDLNTPLFSGSGTENNPYLIENADDLIQLSEIINAYTTHLVNTQAPIVKDYMKACYKVTADIDLAGRDWEPIGDGYKDSVQSFSGTFDGGCFRISGLKYSIGKNDKISHAGLFGHLEKESVVRNVILADSEFHVSPQRTQDSYVGAIAGSSQGVIENCKTENTVLFTGAASNLGGIAGQTSLRTGWIASCTNEADLTTECSVAQVGGIVGTTTVPVSHCENTGSITSPEYAGGIVGLVLGSDDNSFSITHCRNTGNVASGTDSSCYAGGIAASLYAANTNGTPAYITLSDCLNTGSVSGYTAGGAVGKASVTNGAIVLDACTNQGQVMTYPVIGSNAGGISGSILTRQDPGSVSLKNCRNSGKISHMPNETEKLYATVGGITGTMQLESLAPVTVTGCVNEGPVYTQNGSAGGMVSAVSSTLLCKSKGTLKLHFTDCINSGEVNGSGANGCGGILGSRLVMQAEADKLQIALDIAFVNCENSGNVYAHGADAAAGGIAGFLDGKLLKNILVKNCRNSGDMETEASELTEFDQTQDFCVFHGGMVGFIGSKDLLFDRFSDCGVTDVRIHLENNTNTGVFRHPADMQTYLTDDSIAFTPLPR